MVETSDHNPLDHRLAPVTPVPKVTHFVKSNIFTHFM